MKKMTATDRALLLTSAAYLYSNLKTAGHPYIGSWYKDKPRQNNNYKCAVQIASDSKSYFQRTLCFVEGRLYIRDPRHKEKNPWYVDSLSFVSLNRWYRGRYGLMLSPIDMRTIVEICVEEGHIPHRTQDEFDAQITADILCYDPE